MTTTKYPGFVMSLGAVATAMLAAAGARAVPLAVDDAGVVRTVGAGYAGPFRALDVLVAAPAMLLPVGTRALRAALASAFVAAACAAIGIAILAAFAEVVVPDAISRMGVRRANAPVSRRLLVAVALCAALTATLGPVWQAAASAPGGAVVGAFVILAALFVRPPQGRTADDLPKTALVLGLAASYDPLALASVIAVIAPDARALRTSDRVTIVKAAVAFALGLAPLGLSAALRQRDPSIAMKLSGASSIDALAFVRSEIGVVLLALAVIGAAMAMLVPAARSVALSLVLLVAVSGLSLPVRSPGASLLAGVLALHLLAGIALAAIVVAIARAPVPFAQASASLVVVLELVLPVRAADESMMRRESRAPRAASWWTEVAWGPLPPAAVVLVPSPTILGRVAAARAVGEMRGDLVIVPAFDVRSHLGDRALKAEPKLTALYRDIALGSPPEELSFAQLADDRAAVASFDPKWDRSLARHLVPVGLLSRFEPEPRGISDRRRALESFASGKERLVRVSVAKKDPELASATASLLRARAIAMAATGDREVLSRALDDLRPFAPADPVASALVRRLVTTKGAIDVRDLAP